MIESSWLYTYIKTDDKSYTIKAISIVMDRTDGLITVVFDSSDPDSFEVFREGFKAADRVNKWKSVYINDDRVFKYIDQGIKKNERFKVTLKLITPNDVISKVVEEVTFDEDRQLVTFLFV